VNDEALLERLEAAFAPAAVEPPPVLVTEMRAAVDGLGAPIGGLRRRWAAVAAPLVARPRALPRPLVVPVAAMAAVLGVGSTAYAVSGRPLPSGVRGAAYAIGLPVDSPRLVAAQHQRDRLRAAIAGSDTPAVVTAASRLRTDLTHLSRGEQHRLGDVHGLLERAEAASKHGGHGPDQAAQPASKEPGDQPKASDAQGGDDQGPGGARGGRGTAPATAGGGPTATTAAPSPQHPRSSHPKQGGSDQGDSPSEDGGG
jgi:hypothetical protein